MTTQEETEALEALPNEPALPCMMCRNEGSSHLVVILKPAFVVSLNCTACDAVTLMDDDTKQVVEILVARALLPSSKAARGMREALEEVERLRKALAPLAAKRIPFKPQGNAGTYSFLFTEIEAAKAALSPKKGEGVIMPSTCPEGMGNPSVDCAWPQCGCRRALSPNRPLAT